MELNEKVDYLKKYLYVLDNFNYDEVNNDKNEKSNIIWQCWFQGEENAPQIVKLCLESTRKYCNNYKIIVIDDNNLKDYIDDIPEYIYEKLEKGIISKTHFSDILRLYLLDKYGGYWIDATCFISKNIPSVIKKSDFFCFNRQFMKISLSNWFIKSSYPNNILIKTLKNMLLEYWKNEDNLIDYFLFHNFFRIIVQNNEKYLEIYKDSIKVSQNNRYDIGLEYLLPDKKLDYYAYRQLNTTFIIKTTYKKLDAVCYNDIINYFKYKLYGTSYKKLSRIKKGYSIDNFLYSLSWWIPITKYRKMLRNNLIGKYTEY